ncbi:MAG: heme o synthase [Planctomycetota bacterium]|jgi:protoheme IX farnesyltransferase|nr:heme o synthase [Planctomycetota bacterium]MDP7253496.1 heme o synthase [Planctomycetota bacterium]
MADSVDIAQIQKTITAPRAASLGDYLELTKPRLSLLVLFSALVGLCQAMGGTPELAIAFHLLVGTALAAGGASALNMFLERDSDARMQRTENRPLPTGRLSEAEVKNFGIAVSIAGIVYLALFCNSAAAFLGALTVVTYVTCYTPLKKISSVSTVVGAVPGALPILIGWSASGRAITSEAWILFSILFLWQLPHFLAIAWRYREDYARAGYAMLPVEDPGGMSTARQVILQTMGLIAASLTPAFFGNAGALYFYSALGLGVLFLTFGILFAIKRDNHRARSLFIASIVYLPLLLAFLTADAVVS